MRRNRIWLILGGSLALLALIVLGMTPTALAFEGRGGNSVVIEAGEVVGDDLYVGADTFVLDGTVDGDLFVGGTTILINGTVTGDLFAAGQEIVINGTVADDVRVAAAAITFGPNARIADDALVAGYSLETAAGSTVAGDLLFGGGQALLAGEVAGDLHAASSALELRGRTGGRVNAQVGGVEDTPQVNPFMFMPEAPAIPTVRPGLTVGEGAVIVGDLAYSGPERGQLAGRVGGQTRYDPIIHTEEGAEPSAAARFAFWAFTNLQRLLALLLLGLMVVWLWPRLSVGTANALESDPAPSLGYGCLGLVLIPLAIAVLVGIVIFLAVILGVITLGGLAGTILSVGFLVTAALSIAFVLVVAYLTKIVVGLLAGQKILGALNAEWAANRYAAVVTGIFLVVLITAIPYIGWVANLIIALLGVGALWLWWRRMPTELEPEAAAPVKPEAAA